MVSGLTSEANAAFVMMVGDSSVFAIAQALSLGRRGLDEMACAPFLRRVRGASAMAVPGLRQP